MQPFHYCSLTGFSWNWAENYIESEIYIHYIIRVIWPGSQFIIFCSSFPFCLFVFACFIAHVSQIIVVLISYGMNVLVYMLQMRHGLYSSVHTMPYSDCSNSLSTSLVSTLHDKLCRILATGMSDLSFHILL